MKTLALLAFSAAIIATPTIAASKKTSEKNWAQEPTSFLGIDLSGNVVSGLPQCTKTFEHQETEFCYTQVGTMFRFSAKPGLGLSRAYEVWASVPENQVESITLNANSQDFDTLKQLFISKYGKPTTSYLEQVQTNSGAKLNNENLLWSGKHVTILLRKYSSDILTTTASVTNNALSDKAAIERQKHKVEAASKL